MKIKEQAIPRLQPLLPAALAIGFMTCSASVTAAENMDHHAHSMHQMHQQGAAVATAMPDHSQHMQHQGAAAMEDHSQHMQALEQNQKYQRSVNSYRLPEMELVDMHGSAVTLDELLNTDQPLVVNFIFTSCTTICPIMSATFSQAQKRMGEEAKPVRWVSISIDPEYDTPERLRDYASHFHADSNWHFITGEMDRIVRLQKAFGVFFGSKANHKPVTLLRAGRDKPWVRLEGITSGAELVAEYRQLAQ